MVVGDNVACGIDDEPRAERHDFLRRIAKLERLLEKALQKLVEGRAAWTKRCSAPASFIAFALDRCLLAHFDRNVNDGRQHPLGERGKARQRDCDIASAPAALGCGRSRQRRSAHSKALGIESKRRPRYPPELIGHGLRSSAPTSMHGKSRTSSRIRS